MIDHLAVGYSNPFESFDAEANRGWAGIVLARRIEAYLDRWSDALDAASEGIRDAIAKVAADLGRLTFDTDDLSGRDALAMTWHPLFGLAPLHQTDAGVPASALARAAQAALRVAEKQPIEAHIDLGIARGLVFARNLLPAAAALTLSADGEHCRIMGEASEKAWTFTFARAEGWQCRSSQLGLIPQLSLLEQDIVIHAMPRALAMHDPKVVAPDQAMIEGLASAFDLLAGSPAYAGWVARTLRMIVPLRPIVGQYDSESFAALAGGAFISLHPDPVRTAETLVHEASHDHLHLLLGLDPLADASGRECFWSPPRNCERPALGILKAHHAFANVLCFYYLLRLADMPLTSTYARGIDRLEAWHGHFVDCLEHAQSVTPVGEALWRPVAHRVGQLAAIAGRKVA